MKQENAKWRRLLLSYIGYTNRREIVHWIIHDKDEKYIVNEVYKDNYRLRYKEGI